MPRESIKEFKDHYGFTDWDEKALMKLEPLMEKHQDDFIEALYDQISHFSDAKRYLKDEAVMAKHQRALKAWFMKLFKDVHDDRYLAYLEGIGSTHVKVGLPSHYVNASMSFVRNYCTNVISHEITDRSERSGMLLSLGKILDINLDVLTSSYIQEEINFYFVSKKTEGKLINFAKRFSYGLNLVLVLGLVALGVIVLVLFAVDISQIFYGDLEKGLLATLGALLMLWVVIELVDKEVEHLHGAKFSIKVFVAVAMVAVIRKILIASLDKEVVEAQLSMIAALAVLGGLYWMLSQVEKDR